MVAKNVIDAICECNSHWISFICEEIEKLKQKKSK